MGFLPKPYTSQSYAFNRFQAKYIEMCHPAITMDGVNGRTD